MIALARGLTAIMLALAAYGASNEVMLCLPIGGTFHPATVQASEVEDWLALGAFYQDGGPCANPVYLPIARSNP